MSKFPGKTFFRDFNKQFSKINLLLRKKAVLHTITLTHCKTRHFLRDLFSTNQGNGSEMTFGAGVTKINLWQKSYLSLYTKSIKIINRKSQQQTNLKPT